MQYTYVYCPIAQQGTIRYLTVTKNRIRQIYDLGLHLQLLLALAAMKHLQSNIHITKRTVGQTVQKAL